MPPPFLVCSSSEKKYSTGCETCCHSPAIWGRHSPLVVAYLAGLVALVAVRAGALALLLWLDE